ncbi:MAG: chemotaxis protein MotB [Saprospiraceae bacterium]|jgi:chemotaxis protein MotB
MKNSGILLSLCFLIVLSSCNKGKIATLEKEVTFKTQQVKELEEQVAYLKSTNNSQLDLMSELSIVSKTGAENIKKSLESMTQQYGEIQNLNSKIQAKDSLNLALVMNLKRSLSDVNDEDVKVEIRGGKVHVSISDKMLFSSGSATLNTTAKRVLNKIASVLNDHNDLEVMVEGHTDNQPMSNSCILDNWDLSTKRATAVVRTLYEDYYVAPERLIAAGRSEFVPRDDNSNAEGRSVNRRTEIVILPKLDQFFKLMEAPEMPN